MKKDILIKDIETIFDTLICELSKFDEETLNKTPFEGSWTAGQTAEHIIICGSGIPDIKTTESNRTYDEKVKALKEMFLNYRLKYEADPSLEPQSASHKRNKLLQKLGKIKDHLKDVAESSDLEVLCCEMEFPSFGFLTRYEWLRFILFHTQRHTRQIKNIHDLV